MKIVIVYNKFNVKGGSENIIYWLIQGISRLGNEALLIVRVFDERIWGPLESFPCRVVKINPQNVHYSIRNLVLPFFIKKYLKDADIINPHNYPSVIWTVLCKTIFRLKGKIIYLCQEPNRIIHVHNYDGPYLKPDDWKKIRLDIRTPSLLNPIHLFYERHLDLWATKKVSTALVNSRYSADQFSKIFSLSPEICYLGRPSDNIVYSGTLQIPRTYFLCFSRLHEIKNIQSVIMAFSKALSEKPKDFPDLVIAGEGGYKEELTHLCHRLGCQNKVIFKGFIPENEVPAILTGAIALFFLPYREPFGLVTLEAFLNKTPVVGSNEGGPRETIKHGQNGFVVNPNNIDEIAKTMIWFLENPGKAREMGQN